jgi:hypothetical protein
MILSEISQIEIVLFGGPGRTCTKRNERLDSFEEEYGLPWQRKPEAKPVHEARSSNFE